MSLLTQWLRPPAEGADLPAERRHTLFFLEEIRPFAPVFLDTEVDLTGVERDRREAADRRSVVSYVVAAAGRVLAEHPQANAAITPGRRPRVQSYDFVHAKVALDRTINGQRVVLATVVPDVHTAKVDQIQTAIDDARADDPATAQRFAAIRGLHALPLEKGRSAFRKAAAGLTARPFLTGTVAVSSLGHRDVDSFHSVGGTTVTIGVGRVVDRPVVRDGEIVVAPVLRLSLSFDHRVIDGAEAADVLTEIKRHLEAT